MRRLTIRTNEWTSLQYSQEKEKRTNYLSYHFFIQTFSDVELYDCMQRTGNTHPDFTAMYKLISDHWITYSLSTLSNLSNGYSVLFSETLNML